MKKSAPVPKASAAANADYASNLIASLSPSQIAAMSSQMLSLPYQSTALPALLAPAKPAAPVLAASKNVPAFLNKLYNMVCDPSTDELIRWSPDGSSFVVDKHEEFAKEVLPKFFKHNNFSSFVRQLNMYGFHKVPHVSQGSLLQDPEHESWEFANPNFQRNQPDLLVLVTRKKGSKTDEEKPETVDINHILQDITSIKKHQQMISTEIRTIQTENQMLWQECLMMRDKYQRQSQTVEKILRFLASIFSKKTSTIPKKRTFLLGDGSETGNGPHNPVERKPAKRRASTENDSPTSTDEEPIQKKIKELLVPELEQVPVVQKQPAKPTQPTPGSVLKSNPGETAQSLYQHAQELDMDIDLLEDQLYGITGSLGIDFDQWKKDSGNLIEGAPDLIDLIGSAQEDASFPSSNGVRKKTSSAPTSTYSQENNEAEIPDPDLFFNPDAAVAAAASLPESTNQKTKTNTTTALEDSSDADLGFAIDDFLEG